MIGLFLKVAMMPFVWGIKMLRDLYDDVKYVLSSKMSLVDKVFETIPVATVLFGLVLWVVNLIKFIAIGGYSNAIADVKREGIFNADFSRDGNAGIFYDTRVILIFLIILAVGIAYSLYLLIREKSIIKSVFGVIGAVLTMPCMLIAFVEYMVDADLIDIRGTFGQIIGEKIGLSDNIFYPSIICAAAAGFVLLYIILRITNVNSKLYADKLKDMSYLMIIFLPFTLVMVENLVLCVVGVFIFILIMAFGLTTGGILAAQLAEQDAEEKEREGRRLLREADKCFFNSTKDEYIREAEECFNEAARIRNGY